MDAPILAMRQGNLSVCLSASTISALIAKDDDDSRALASYLHGHITDRYQEMIDVIRNQKPRLFDPKVRSHVFLDDFRLLCWWTLCG